MLAEKDVLAALSRIPGPDGSTPLNLSGAIAGVSIQSGKVYLSVSIDPAQSMALEPMRRAAEEAIRMLPGVSGALVTLTSERPQGQQRTAPAAPGPKASGSSSRKRRR